MSLDGKSYFKSDVALKLKNWEKIKKRKKLVVLTASSLQLLFCLPCLLR
jgi:hypothetical protein